MKFLHDSVVNGVSREIGNVIAVSFTSFLFNFGKFKDIHRNNRIYNIFFFVILIINNNKKTEKTYFKAVSTI